MTDQQLEQLGISGEEMFRLHRLWNTIAPNEPNGYDCRCKEQLDWNMQHADYYFYGAGDGYVIVDMVEYRENAELEHLDLMKNMNETQLERMNAR